MNASSNFLAVDLKERKEGIIFLEATFAIAMNMASFLGNILVCLAIHRNNRLQTIPNLFVVALALSDLFVAVLSMPFSAAILIAGRWIFDKDYHFCIFLGFCLFQCGISSLQMLCQIAVNRYFCVVRPNLYRKIYTRKKAKSIIVLSWVLVLSVTIPPLVMNPGRYSFQPGKAMCLYPMEKNKAFTLFLIAFFIVAPMNIIAFGYYKVYKTVNISGKNFRVKGQHNGHSTTVNVEEAKVTRTLAAVVAAFAICWLPVGLIDFIDVIHGEAILPRQLYLMYAFLVYLSSTTNPFIYAIFSRTFRREYRKLLCGRRNLLSSINDSRTYKGKSTVHPASVE